MMSMRSMSIRCCTRDNNQQTLKWDRKAKPIKKGSVYPAKEYCSQCGLCDTYYVEKVNEACAFLNDGKLLLFV